MLLLSNALHGKKQTNKNIVVILVNLNMLLIVQIFYFNLWPKCVESNGINECLNVCKYTSNCICYLVYNSQLCAVFVTAVQ